MKYPADVTQLAQPIELKLGTYIPQWFDARMTFLGLDWYRVSRGFGGRGDRIDWIADVPAVALSVASHRPANGGFGWNSDSPFELVAAAEVKRYLGHALREREAAIAKLVELTDAITTLTGAEAMA